MSASATMAAVSQQPSFQPFECHVCNRRFTRHENLKRHSALHTRSPGDSLLACTFCDATFSRPDLRHRHLKAKHAKQAAVRSHDRRTARARSSPQASSPSQSPTSSRGTQCDAAGQSAAADSGSIHQQQHRSPNSLAWDTHQLDLDMSVFAASSQLINLKGALDNQDPSQQLSQSAPFADHLPGFSFDQAMVHLDDGCLSSLDYKLNNHNAWSPSAVQISRGCDLYFNHFSPFTPCIHRSTFDPSTSPEYLVLAVLCLGYQYGDDPVQVEQSALNNNDLSLRCFDKARALLAQEEAPRRTQSLDNDQPQSGHNPAAAHALAKVQAYLLLQIYAMMYNCGSHYSSLGLEMHARLISIARASGLIQQISSLSTAETGDLDSLWREFARNESHKRTIFAAHQIDTLWYQLLSVPRQFSHLEIKHELPCPEQYWTASSSGEWAHRQLVDKKSGQPVQYPGAIRRFLSPDADLTSMPAFDPYGAINITHFLISSAREISGWSSMTGMLSLERFEPIRASLLALGPFIRPQSKPGSSSTQLCEATWEMAMIEVQIWSPSHTEGVVGSSMDVVLRQFNELPGKCEFLCEPETARTIQPHLNWFLRYLDSTLVPDSEAPWLMLYAYKAFMIAWHFLVRGVPDSMQAVGVPDGDLYRALAWAREVFQRREPWQLGKMIMAHLDALGT